MTTLHFANARLIDPEAGTDSPGSLTVRDGAILGRDAKPPKGAEITPRVSPGRTRAPSRASGRNTPSVVARYQVVELAT